MACENCVVEQLRYLIPPPPKFIDTTMVDAEHWLTGYGVRIAVPDLTDDHLRNILAWLERFVDGNGDRIDLRYQAALRVIRAGDPAKAQRLVLDAPWHDVWRVFFPSYLNLIREARKRGFEIPMGLPQDG